MSEKRFDSAGRLMPAQRGVVAPFETCAGKGRVPFVVTAAAFDKEAGS